MTIINQVPEQKKETNGPPAWYHFPLVTSTNTVATLLVSKIRPRHGTAITADYQTLGRGQNGRAWHSTPGKNALLSSILYPGIDARHQFLLNAAVSVAVAEFLAELSGRMQIQIKWPNDIYIGDRKVAGLLIQNQLQGQKILSCVAGVGLNVLEKGFPPEIPHPTSLLMETGCRYDVPEIRHAIGWLLAGLFRDAGPGREEEIKAHYHHRLYLRDTPALFRRLPGDTIMEGVIRYVDADGRLVLENGNGKTEAFVHHEIAYASTQDR